MSLGLLGKYGSDSSSGISDSDDNDGDDYKNKSNIEVEKDVVSPVCYDPLSLGLDGSDESEDSGSETNSTSPVPSPVGICTSLPLPDIDRVVARNPSYLSSGLAAKTTPGPVDRGQTVEGEGGRGEENSVFFNPFKKAEEERLAILKHHVQEFDKKPFVKEDSEATRGYSDGRRGYRTRTTRRGYRGGFSTAIPPPMSYAKQSGREGLQHGHAEMTHHAMGQMAGKGNPQYSSGQMTGNPQYSGGQMTTGTPYPSGGQVGGNLYHSGGQRNPHHYGAGGPTGGNPVDPYCEESIPENELFGEDDSSSLVKKPRKHRSGVTDSLLPPKKFMRSHERIQAKERPWTLNK